MYVRYIAAHSQGKYMAVRSRIFHLPPLFPVNPRLLSAATATPKILFSNRMFSTECFTLYHSIHDPSQRDDDWLTLYIFRSYWVPNRCAQQGHHILKLRHPEYEVHSIPQDLMENRKRKKYFCYHHHQLIKRNHCSTFLPHSATFSSYFCSFAVQEILAVLKNLAD